MAGPLAPLAAGAAIVGAAFKSLGDIVRQQVDTLKQGIQTAAAFSQAARGAELASQDRALGVVRSHANARRRLAFRGGSGAVRSAEGIAARGGVSLADAEAGVLASMDVQTGADERRGITEAAYAIARTGEMSMAEAVKAVSSSPMARNLIRSNGTAMEVAAAVLGRGDPKRRAMMERAMVDTAGEGALNQADNLQPIENQTETTLANDASGAETAARRNLGSAKDATGAAVLAVANQMAQGVSQMRKAVDSMSTIARLYDRLTGNRAALDYQAAAEGFAKGVDMYEGAR